MIKWFFCLPRPVWLGIVWLSIAVPAVAQRTLSELREARTYYEGADLLQRQQFAAARLTFEAYQQPQRLDLQATDAGTYGRQTPQSGTIEADYYTALAALNLFNDDAESRVEQFIDRYPDHPKAMLAYYDLGSFYYNQQKFDKAASYLSKVNRKALGNDQQREVQFKLGYSYFAQKKFDLALKALNPIKRETHAYTAAASYYAAYAEMRNGDYAEALADLKRAETDATYRPMVSAMTTYIYYQQGDYDRVISYGEAALNEGQQVSSPGEIALMVGDAYFLRGDYEAAARNFNEYTASTRGTSDPALRYRIGYANFMAGQFDAAAEQFKVVASKPDTLGQFAAYYMGLSYIQMGNLPFAVTAMDQARKLDFDARVREQAAFNHAKLNADLGRTAEAVDGYKRFLNDYPRSELRSEASGLLSEAYLNANNYDAAITEIEQMKQRTPRVNAAYQRVTFYKGIQLFNAKQFIPALKMFEKSLQNPVDEELTLAAHFWSGETYSIGQLYPEAINQYAAIFRQPNAARYEYHLRARYGIGYAYYNGKEYAKALPHFLAYTEALENAPDPLYYGDALIRLADCQYMTKDYAAAQRTYDKAIGKKVAEPDYAYYQKGAVQYLQNQNDPARTSLQAVLTQFPKSRYRDDALAQLAQMDFEEGKYEAAVAGFSRLIQDEKQSPLLPYAHLRRATAYSNLQQPAKAAADYRLILEKYPTDKAANSAILGLQESLTAMGQIEQFSTYLESYKRANPQSDALESIEFETGKTLFFNQKYEQAIRSLEAHQQRYPQSGFGDQVKFYLGESYFRTNQPDVALRYHQQVLRANSPLRNRSLARAAELTAQQKQYAASVSYYRQLLQAPANRREQTNAEVGLLENYFELQRYDSVNYFAEQILRGEGIGLEAESRANLLAGRAAYAKGDYAKATDYFLNTANAARDEYAAEAQYWLADIQYRQKNYQQSLETLYDLNRNYGNLTAWLDRSFLLIADNFIALGETFQARATLNSIAEKSKDENTRRLARQKLQTLGERNSASETSDQ